MREESSRRFCLALVGFADQSVSQIGGVGRTVILSPHAAAPHPRSMKFGRGRVFLPLPVLRERVGVRVFCLSTRKSPHPNPLPEYREREPEGNIFRTGTPKDLRPSTQRQDPSEYLRMTVRRRATNLRNVKSGSARRTYLTRDDHPLRAAILRLGGNRRNDHRRIVIFLSNRCDAASLPMRPDADPGGRASRTS